MNPFPAQPPSRQLEDHSLTLYKQRISSFKKDQIYTFFFCGGGVTEEVTVRVGRGERRA
jgi:hypothetical protein